MGRTAIMNSDGQYSTHPKKMQKKIVSNTIVDHREIIAKVLRSNFGSNFRTKKIIVGNQAFIIDLMSDDGNIAVKIISSSGITSQGSISSTKFQNILSSILVLKSLDCERRLVVFTNPHMYEEFTWSIKVAREPISNIVKEIDMVLIPLWGVHEGNDFFNGSEKRIFRNRNQIERVLKDAQDDWK
jgi:hypothetical protein